MPRAGTVGFVAAFAAGLGIAVAGAAGAPEPTSFTLATLPLEKLADLERGDQVCQTPVSTPERLEVVELVVAPGAQERGPVRVRVREVDVARDAAGEVLATATLPRQVLTGRPVRLRFDSPVPAERFVSVCVEHSGAEPVEVWGDRPIDRTPSTSRAELNGIDLGGDLALSFPDPDGGTLLERIPAAFDHAAPYKLGGLGAWAFWGLLGALVLGAPVLLIRALSRAARDVGDT